MSIFGSIVSKIFGHEAEAATAGAPPAPGPEANQAVSQTDTAPAQRPVDVEAVLTDLAPKNGPELNWRSSIVDLLKLLSLDSSLGARKELAEELHYPGDTNDSARMNVWLHREIMQKLAENGGKLPQDVVA